MESHSLVVERLTLTNHVDLVMLIIYVVDVKTRQKKTQLQYLERVNKMQYKETKLGYIAVIETTQPKGITQNVILHDNINKLRKLVGNFIVRTLKKIKPDGEMILWQTKIGQFCLFKDRKLDYSFEPYKEKYDYINTKLEFAPKKGEIKTITIKSRRIINKEFEGLEECPNCCEKGLIEYSIKRMGKKILVCKKCQQFDKIIHKIDKKEELTKAEIRSLRH